MSIELKFDKKKFGCNADAVEELVAEIVRCVNVARPNAGNRFGYDITLAAPEPEGVWVKPGMRVAHFTGGLESTVAPKHAHRHRMEQVRPEIRDTLLSVWNANGTESYGPMKSWTHKGKPVLGYEEDKP